MVEDLTFLISVHRMRAAHGISSLARELLHYFDDTFLRAVEGLHLATGLDGPLVACDVDLINAFWSLYLPPQLRDLFRVTIDQLHMA